MKIKDYTTKKLDITQSPALIAWQSIILKKVKDLFKNL